MKEKDKYEICPIRDILSRLSDKWSLLVIITLSKQDKMRFGELKNELDDISQRMLTVTLRSLEADGLISRTVYAVVPPKVEYKLTELGTSILTPLYELINWAKEHATSIVASREK